jgi:hypothetical protein
MPGRARAYVKPAPPAPTGDFSLPPTHRGKMLKPAEVGEILGMPASEVLVLPGLVRVSLSPQRVVYAPADVEAFVNRKRTTQGFLAGIDHLFGLSHRPVTVNRVCSVVRIGRPPARWLLDQCKHPFPEELAEVLRRFASLQ